MKCASFDFSGFLTMWLNYSRPTENKCFLSGERFFNVKAENVFHRNSIELPVQAVFSGADSIIFVFTLHIFNLHTQIPSVYLPIGLTGALLLALLCECVGTWFMCKTGHSCIHRHILVCALKCVQIWPSFFFLYWSLQMEVLSRWKYFAISSGPCARPTEIVNE